VAGIIQEQHPDRARLFMQWKGMDWPIMIDSLNRLGVSAVPITLLVDEHGIIRAVQPGEEDFREVLERSHPKREARQQAIIELPGDATFLWEDVAQVSEAIDAYHQALAAQEAGPIHFRLGVAYRRRYDSAYRRDGDFARAVEHWGRALDIDPNQYIWRRRIQQYGPRLTKPYSFYDWVSEARQEIGARGEAPLPLDAEPGGAEFAYPAESFPTTDSLGKEPDPRGRIRRDEEGLIRAETAVVPTVMAAGESVRVHVVFRPNPAVKAHWNNEVDDLVFWVDVPEGWEVDQRYLTVSIPPEPVSQEVRKVEFELKSPANASSLTMMTPYALYYVCEDVNGACLFRRQDIPLEIRVD
jgi:hypothetical protein